MMARFTLYLCLMQPSSSLALLALRNVVCSILPALCFMLTSCFATHRIIHPLNCMHGHSNNAKDRYKGSTKTALHSESVNKIQ